jgi:hypothetical protein
MAARSPIESERSGKRSALMRPTIRFDFIPLDRGALYYRQLWLYEYRAMEYQISSMKCGI